MHVHVYVMYVYIVYIHSLCVGCPGSSVGGGRGEQAGAGCAVTSPERSAVARYHRSCAAQRSGTYSTFVHASIHTHTVGGGGGGVCLAMSLSLGGARTVAGSA